MRRRWQVALWVPVTFALLVTLRSMGEKADQGDSGWAAFELAELEARRAESGRPYLPFLDEKAMSAGLYELAAGAIDHQRPHERDEVYYIVRGKARFEVAGDDIAVGPGSVLYVRAEVAHRFHSIEEDLEVLVVFAGEP